MRRGDIIALAIRPLARRRIKVCGWGKSFTYMGICIVYTKQRRRDPGAEGVARRYIHLALGAKGRVYVQQP